MMEIIMKMLFCLLIAAIIGGIIGWLLRSLFCKSKFDEYEGRLRENEEEMARLRASLSKAKGDASTENDKDDAEIAALKAQISSLEGNLKTSADLDADWSKKYAALEADLKTSNESYAKLETESSDWKTKLAELTAAGAGGAAVGAVVSGGSDSEISSLQAKIKSLESDLKISHERQFTLESDLKGWESKASTLSSAGAVATDDGEINRLRAALDEANKTNANLEAKLKVVRSDDAADEAEITRLRAELDGLKVKLNETETERVYLLGQVKKAESGESIKREVPMDQRDDLELIHGVGPVLERMLYDMGIYYFKDIASWDAAKIAEMNEKLPNFRGRIERENWVESAKEEHFKKYGEKL